LPASSVNGGYVREIFGSAGSRLSGLADPHVAATHQMQVMTWWSLRIQTRFTMLKIVPDPPHDIHSLEDTLIQATDYALCATTVVHQALLLQPKSPVSILMMASMHELEALRALLESALIQVQMPASPRTLH